MDLSGLSDQDLAAVSSGNMGKVSDAGLDYISKQGASPAAANIAPHPATPPTYDMGDAALQGFGQGASFGYLPYLQAWGNKVYEPNTSYDTLLKYWQGRNKDIQDQNPGTMATSQIAGNLAATAPLMAGKGLSLLARLGRAGMVGSGTGFIQNPEADATNGTDGEFDLTKRLENGGLGVALGLGGEALAEGAAGAGNLLAKAGKKLSGQSILTQMGANAGQIGQILKKDQLPALEKFMTTEGLMSPGQNIDSILDKTGSILDEEGPNIAQSYKDAQAKANNIKEMLGSGDYSDIQVNAKKLAQQIYADTKDAVKSHPDQVSVLKTARDSLMPLFNLGEDANLSDVHAFRKGLDENVNWSKAANEKDALQRFYTDARTSVNKSLQDTIGNIDYVLGSDDPLVQQLKNSNQRFSNASIVNAIANKSAGREGAKAFMGLGLLGGLGAGGGIAYSLNKGDDLPTALAKGGLTALTMYGARKYGAPAGYGAGQLLQQIPRLTQYATKAPGAIGAISGQISPWLNSADQQ